MAPRFPRLLYPLLAMLAASPPGGAVETLRIRGSDTMDVLNNTWVEAYRRENPSLRFDTVGGGSELGIQALLKCETDIAAMSRPLTEPEKTAIAAAGGAPPLEIVVGLDAVAIYVHESNPLHSLSLAQLHDIYTGRITSWSGLGGSKLPIQLMSRNLDSGTRTFFVATVLQGHPMAGNAMLFASTAALAAAVADRSDAIGFGGIAYSQGSRILPVTASTPAKAVWPSPKAVARGEYPLSRKLYYYVHPPAAARPETARFLDWVRGPHAQALAAGQHYIPLPAAD